MLSALPRPSKQAGILNDPPTRENVRACPQPCYDQLGWLCGAFERVWMQRSHPQTLGEAWSSWWNGLLQSRPDKKNIIGFTVQVGGLTLPQAGPPKQDDGV